MFDLPESADIVDAAHARAACLSDDGILTLLTLRGETMVIAGAGGLRVGEAAATALLEAGAVAESTPLHQGWVQLSRCGCSDGATRSNDKEEEEEEEEEAPRRLFCTLTASCFAARGSAARDAATGVVLRVRHAYAVSQPTPLTVRLAASPALGWTLACSDEKAASVWYASLLLFPSCTV